MTEFKTLHPLIKAVIPSSIPTFTLTDAIREATRKFCDKTCIIEEKIVIYTEAGVKRYRLRIFDESVVAIMVVNAEVNGQPYRGFYSCPNTRNIDFNPAPSEELDVELTLAVKPSLASVGIDYGVLEDYAEIIRDGAMEVLLNQRGNAWFDPESAMAYKSDFEKGISAVLADKHSKFTNLEESAYTGDFL